MEPTVIRCAGDAIHPYLEDAARLRISVFREFPYLYEGAEDYEREYMATYAGCPGSVFVIATVASEVVGISTGLPLVDADDDFRQPFLDAGFSTRDWFYFGESVLAPEWRGRGLGHLFFDEREAHARELGYRRLAFCSVTRPEGHPLCPADYHSHDVFWTKRGFSKHAELVASVSWPQIDSAGQDVENELVFWTRDLGPAAVQG